MLGSNETGTEKEFIGKEFIIKGKLKNDGTLEESQIIYDLANQNRRYYNATETTVKSPSITNEQDQNNIINLIKTAVEKKSQGGYNKKNNKGSRRLRQKKRKTYNKSRKSI